MANVDSSTTRARRIARGLFPHQVEGVAFLLGRRRALLADDMGLGKTRQAIVALRVHASEGPYLVICPASVKRNWAREIDLALEGDDVLVVDGAMPHPRGRGNRIEAPARWVIVNYDILGKHTDWLARVVWGGIVFDEAHYLKNHKSARTRRATELAKAAAAFDDEIAIFALTGTPLTNRPRDLFPLLQLLGHPMGRSFISFAKRYCAAYQNEYGWVTDGASNLDELAVQLRGTLLRRTKDDVLDLPPKLRTYLPVDVPEGTGAEATRRVLRALLGKRFGNSEASESRSAASHRSERGHLLAFITTLRRQVAVAKTKHTLDLVDSAVEQGEKVLVFSCFEDPVLRIAEHFGDRALVLTGSTPAAARQEIVDRFQTDDAVPVLVANLIAGGVGLNLTAARQVVFNDLDWVPANHWQAEDRAYRIGQTRTVNVSYVVASGTIDEFVSLVLEAKTRLAEAVVDGRAIGDAGTRDALAELESVIASLSPGFADTSLQELDATEAKRLLDRASAEVRARSRQQSPAQAANAPARAAVPDAAFERAVSLLADVLSGPKVRRWRTGSGSKPGVFYELEADSGGDVTCNCPGFEYRGACTHARDLKAGLAKNAISSAYKEVA